jgi:uncharacterized protein
MKWRTLSKEKIDDIVEFVRAETKDGQTLHIGTDSLQTGRYTQFVTVVVILKPGKGGRVAFAREATTKPMSLRERLFKEAWRSVELALSLNTVVPGEITIHVDANPEERYMSNKYIQELVGLVVGNGFKALIKPDSWAATHCADWVVRHRGHLPKASEIEHVKHAV